MRFLVVDDNPDDRELIIRSLKKEFPDTEFLEIIRRKDFDEAIDRGSIDLVLTDYRLTWTDGLWILKAVKDKNPHIPVIMITDSGSEEIAVEGMKLGLSDYVLKRNLRRLPFAVADALESFRLHKKYDEAIDQLRISEERYRTVSELTSDFAYASRVEADGRLVREWVTGAFSRITGYSPDEMDIRDKWQNLAYPGDADVVAEHQKRVLSGQPDVSEFRIIVKDGALRWLRDSSLPAFDERGRVTRIYGAAQDITESKRAEEALRRAFEELEVRVAERTTGLSESNARLKQEVGERKRAEEVSKALNYINAAISSTLNFEEIMAKVVVEATQAIGTESAFVVIREGNYWALRYAYGLPEESIGNRYLDEQLPVVALAAKDRQIVVINDAGKDTRINLETAEKFGVSAFLAVPLIVRGDVLGVLSFIYHTKAITFTPFQIDFANKLASSVSLAIENARLYQAERNISDTLQEALLTVPEKIEGVEFGHLYKSATETTRVGGDFYDIFELEHGRVGVIIGDVSGKGLEAATLTSLVKNTIKAYAYEDLPVAKMMQKTNEVVRRTSSLAVFVTVFFGILDVNTDILTYCSAGHPPAILKKPTGTLLLITGSPVIGAFSNLNFIDDSTQLEKGDVLILYTDGITEARCDSEFFGEERLIKFLSTLSPTGVKDMPLVIFDEVLRCAGGKLTDDVALVTLGVK